MLTMDKTCCVRGCRNESYEGCGITLHSFPTDEYYRAKWCKALGYKPKTKNPVICSGHFKKEDFNYATMPLRLFDFAVPCIVKSSETPAELKFCRICLSMDVKLHDLKDSYLREMYQNITGIQVAADGDSMQQCICWECTGRLRAAVELREKARVSSDLLYDLLCKVIHRQITTKDIKSLKKKYTSLNSSLVIENVFFFTTETEDYPEEPSKDEERDIVLDNNNKENEINSNNVDNDDIANENLAVDEDEDEEITERYLDIEDFGDEIINEVEIENTDEENEDSRASEDDKVEKTAQIPIVINNNSKKRKGLYLDENDGHFKEGIINTDVEKKRKSTEHDMGVAKRIKIVKEILNDAGLQADQLRQKLGYDNTDEKKRTKADKSFASLFITTRLTYDEQIKEVLKRKDSDKYIRARYKCSVCYRGYMTKYSFTTHLEKHNPKNGIYDCFICKSRMKTERALQNHLAGQHVEQYNCKKCPFVTRSKGVAQKHEKYHAGTKYQCPHCGSVFDQYSTYMGHLRIKHVSDYVCELCGYTFVSKKGIEVHKNAKHIFLDKTVTLEGPYCEVCDVKFASEEAHDRHLRLSSKHISEKDPSRLRNDSQHKGDGIRPRRGGVRRMMINSPVPPDCESPKPHAPVSCEQCGVELGNLALYAQHFRSIHPDKNRTKFASNTTYMCEQCGNLYHSMSSLEDHKWVHTGEKSFKCDQCPKSYAHKYYLLLHKREHNGTRESYSCHICGKQFSLYSNRQRHMLTHTDLKPYKCEICGKCFTTNSSRKNHIKHVHLRNPWPKRIRHRGKSSKCDELSAED